MPHIGEAGHTKIWICDAARDNSVKMAQIGVNIDADSVERDPLAHANANGSYFVLVANALVGTLDPDADTILATLPFDIELSKPFDDPPFQRCNKPP